MLEAQKKGEVKKYKVVFGNIGEYQESDYSSDLRLNINKLFLKIICEDNLI